MGIDFSTFPTSPGRPLEMGSWPVLPLLRHLTLVRDMKFRTDRPKFKPPLPKPTHLKERVRHVRVWSPPLEKQVALLDDVINADVVDMRWPPDQSGGVANDREKCAMPTPIPQFC